MTQAEPVHIWTDGACKGNPGAGGWGALLRFAARGTTHEKPLYGGEPYTTNNRMELLAVIRALQALTRPADVVIHTDSQYVQKGMTEWLANWKRRGWVTAAKQPVKNADLWQLGAVNCGWHERLLPPSGGCIKTARVHIS